MKYTEYNEFIYNYFRILKKYSTSISVSSAKSVQCIAFSTLVLPNRALIVCGRSCFANS